MAQKEKIGFTDMNNINIFCFVTISHFTVQLDWIRGLLKNDINHINSSQKLRALLNGH